MMLRLVSWLTRKWQPVVTDDVLRAYQLAFSTPEGQVVLQHLMDAVYCQVYVGKDPTELAMQNGRRSVVHEILENIDKATNPGKYT
jgi:hypothetical protein